MRRSPSLAVAALALTVALGACGDDDDDDASGATTPEGSATPAASDDSEATPATDDTVVDASLVPTSSVPVPEVEIPESIPTELVVTEITPGTGDPAGEGDTVYVNYVGVRSEDGTQFDTNFGGQPFPVTLGAGGVIEGWEQGLAGVTAGERLQLDIPSDLAYGDQPQGEVIQAGDALTFLIDVLAILPPTDPAGAPTTEELPLSTELVDEVVVEDLRDGDGATLEAGGTGVFHLVAARADDGTVLQSTWDAGQPQPIQIADGALIPELVESLPGMKVGGRRVIRVPSNPDMGLTPETDVLIVADLVAVF